ASALVSTAAIIVNNEKRHDRLEPCWAAKAEFKSEYQCFDRRELRRSLTGAVLAVIPSIQTSWVLAQPVKFQMDYQLAWDCTHPIRLSNFITRVRGSGVLNPDRSASADFYISGG